LVNSGTGGKTIGSLGYRYEPATRSLRRLERDYSGVYEGADALDTASLAEVIQARFLYYAWDEQAREYRWLEQWQTGELPVAVRLEFLLRHEEKELHYTRSVFLPRAR
jgi:hypothetical protein